MPSAVSAIASRTRFGGEPGPDQRDPAAGIEQRHHVAPAPAVGEPTGRQREHAECDERGGAERDQLGIAPAVDHLEPDHHGREDQHHEMVERVRPIDEADGQPMVRGFGRLRHRCGGWRHDGLRVRCGSGAAIRIYRDCRPNIHAEMTGQTISRPDINRESRFLLHFTGVAPPIREGGHVETMSGASLMR